jgi:hypothetical protein
MIDCIDDAFAGEQCDGDRIAWTCKDLGYASGETRCTPTCRIDVSGCEDCMWPTQMLQCSHAIQSPRAYDLALATNGTEIAMAWVLFGQQGSLHFALLRRDLSVISETPCVLAGDFLSARPNVTIAATPSGWIVVAVNRAGIANDTFPTTMAIVTLDRQGRVTGTRQAGGGANTRLYGRDDGGPLLTYAPNPVPFQEIALREHWAVMLNEDGTEAWPPVRLTNLVSLGQRAGGAFVGGAFLVATAGAPTPGADTTTELVRVDLTGQVTSVGALSTGQKKAHIAWNGREARILYGASYNWAWQRIDAFGAALGPPVNLPDLGFDDEPRLALVGDSTIVLVRANVLTRPANLLTLTRFAQDGNLIVGPIGVATQTDVYQPRDMLSIDNDIYVGWESLTVSHLRAE